MEPMTMLAIAGGAAGLNALGGGIGSYLGAKGAAQAARTQRDAAREAMDFAREGQAQAEGYYQPYMDTGTQALGMLSSESFQDPARQFQYSGDVESFLDPSMQYQQQQAQRALEQSAVARGGLLGTGTAKALQNQAQQFAQQDYANAFNRMATDRNFAYNQFLQEAQARRANLQARYNQLSQLTGIGQQAAGSLAAGAQNLGQNLGNLNMQAGQYQAMAQQAPYIAAQQFFGQQLPQAISGGADIYGNLAGIKKPATPTTGIGG